MRSFTWDQVRALRLTRSYLLTRAPRERLVDVVGNVCGVQAQVMGAAELAIGARVDGLTQLKVRAELWDRRTLVKTYGPRGTLHILPARELPMWMAALRAIPNHHGVMCYELTEVTSGQVDELGEATREALDGRRLTRDGLARAVSRRVGAWAHQRALLDVGRSPRAGRAHRSSLLRAQRRSEGHVRASRSMDRGWREEDPALRVTFSSSRVSSRAFLRTSSTPPAWTGRISSRRFD